MKFAKWELMLDNTIHLPAIPELQGRLREKLKEYRKRVSGYREKYASKKLGLVVDRDSNLLDAVYKSEIVSALLEEGRIEVRDIHDRIAADFDGYVSEDVFSNAVSVISDYISTGGAHTEGGSGFFTDKMFEDLLRASEALELPEDATQRAEIQNKYYECLGRNVDIEKHAETTVDRAALKRNTYKARILSDLRDHHRVLIPELARALAKETGRSFDRMEFYNAACQVRDLLSRLRR